VTISSSRCKVYQPTTGWVMPASFAKRQLPNNLSRRREAEIGNIEFVGAGQVNRICRWPG
jgi:hypothetical protein